MSLLVNSYLSGPLWVRSAVAFSFIFIFWMISGRMVLWVLSLFPFLAGKIFRHLYLLLEIPLDLLHKGSGSVFGEINNWMSRMGGRIDNAMLRWYHAWHSLERPHIGKTMLFCTACVLMVNLWNTGKEKFLSTESFLADLIVNQNWYDPDAVFEAGEDVEESFAETDTDVFEIELVAAGLDSSLLIRSHPSIDAGEVLGRLYNDDVVIWSGKMTFAEVNDGSIEPWVKIRTLEGIEGWSRLYYLQPTKYENLELVVSMGME